MKKTIDMNSSLYNFHNFGKQNLVSHNDGSDTYVCEDCGIKGKRAFLSPEIYLARVSKEKLEICNGKKGVFEIITKENIPVEFTTKKVKVIVDTNLDPFGVVNGDMLDTIKCPNPEDNHLDGVWVVSTKCPQGFRMLNYEYEELTNE